MVGRVGVGGWGWWGNQTWEHFLEAVAQKKEGDCPGRGDSLSRSRAAGSHRTHSDGGGWDVRFTAGRPRGGWGGGCCGGSGGGSESPAEAGH